MVKYDTSYYMTYHRPPSYDFFNYHEYILDKSDVSFKRNLGTINVTLPLPLHLPAHWRHCSTLYGSPTIMTCLTSSKSAPVPRHDVPTTIWALWISRSSDDGWPKSECRELLATATVLQLSHNVILVVSLRWSNLYLWCSFFNSSTILSHKGTEVVNTSVFPSFAQVPANDDAAATISVSEFNKELTSNCSPVLKQLFLNTTIESTDNLLIMSGTSHGRNVAVKHIVRVMTLFTIKSAPRFQNESKDFLYLPFDRSSCTWSKIIFFYQTCSSSVTINNKLVHISTFFSTHTPCCVSDKCNCIPHITPNVYFTSQTILDWHTNLYNKFDIPHHSTSLIHIPHWYGRFMTYHNHHYTFNHVTSSIHMVPNLPMSCRDLIKSVDVGPSS